MTDAVRASMMRESRRLITDVRRPFRTVAGPTDIKNMNKITRLGKKGLQRGDPRLATFSEHVPPELFRIISDAALFLTSQSAFAKPMFEFAIKVFPIKELIEKLQLEMSATEISKEIYLAFNGFLQIPEGGDEPQQGSMLYSIQCADSQLIMMCRDFCNLKQKLFNLTPVLLNKLLLTGIIDKDVASFSSYVVQFYPWNLMICLLFLHATFRSSALKDAMLNVDRGFRDDDFYNFVKYAVMQGSNHV